MVRRMCACVSVYMDAAASHINSSSSAHGAGNTATCVGDVHISSNGKAMIIDTHVYTYTR